MKIIGKQDLSGLKTGTLLATNDGMDEPWKLFLLGVLFMEDGVVTDFWMVDPLNGDESREQMYDDHTTYIMFDADEIQAIIRKLRKALIVQFP